jgi:iron-sulfur cluster repair protein YtfE (RIC family)
MATARTSATSSSRDSSRSSSASRSTRSAGDQDAIEKLKEDHRKVEKLFDQYESTKDEMSAEEKAELVETICGELVVHTQIEEEIFYPSIRAAGDEELDELLDEAEVEHSGAKDLIAQLEDSTPEEPLYDAKVTVLGEYVKHHVKEEENEMFPMVKKAKDIDLDELGVQLRERAEQLKQELGID